MQNESLHESVTRILLSSLAYIVIVFPLAVGWHVGLFKEKYEAFGYFDGEPKVLLGLAAIVIQGTVLSLVYPMFRSGIAGFTRAFQFVGLMGLFFWTTHVLAFLAKNTTPDPIGFFVMETGYLIAQFGLFGLALAFIYRGVQWGTARERRTGLK